MDAPPETPPPAQKKPVSKYQILVALRESKGNRQEASRSLGITKDNLTDRIKGDSQLNALYGGDQPAPPPTESEVMTRKPGDIPASLPNVAVNALKVVSLVSPEDTERLLDGLKDFDFSAESLRKIRSLGNLATDTGRFIAVSLEKTHQNYVVQQFGLMELAADIRRQLLIPKGEDGYVEDNETRAFMNHNYVEMVRESGRGVKLSIEMAEVITRMLESASSKVKNAKTRMGWKKVTAVEASATPLPDAETGS